MPQQSIIVKQANGQQLVLSPGDQVVQEITIVCESRRCASRLGQEKPASFTFLNNDPDIPANGDQFINVGLPTRSPSNAGEPRWFCSAACTRDYLVYEYLAPGPREISKAFGPVSEQPPVTAEAATRISATEAGFIINSVSQADGCSDPGDCHQ